MTKTRKALKWIAIVLAFLFIGVPLLLAVINAFDEELKPEALAFADFSGETIAPEQNGYFAWVGLRAPMGEHPHTRGLQIVAQVNDKLDAVPHDIQDVINPDTFLGPKALKFSNKLASLCGRDTTGCLDRYRAKTTDIEKQVRENKVLLERYHSLYRYPHFHETLKPRYYAPLFIDPGSVSSLARAQYALHALRGNPSLALRQLHDDTLFWRHILVETRGLVGKMLAVAVIQRNSQLTSEIVARYPTGKAALAQTVQAVLPLTDAERDLTKVYRNEFAINMHAFTALSTEQQSPCTAGSTYDCAVDRLMSTFLFKPYASTNRSFEGFSQIAATSKLPAPEFLKAIREKLDSDQYDWQWWLSSWRFAYNPIGKILNAIAEPAYASYTARIHNLDGFLRLVSLSLTARQQSVRDADMPAFLARAHTKFSNPYTNEPMLWDADTRTIYFKGMGESNDHELLSKRIGIRLGK